ncbi:MAG: ketoacyl-ACP synthase III [Lachnospiraceae bacterium]|nr:ketoacyl-ACP synthase III [Lachnospiraceae bacterium]
MTARIIGTGSYLPSNVVTNHDLEKIMDTTDEWIKSRTGIGQRHIAIEETTTSMAVEAAKRALADADTTADELDLIVVGTVSADRHFPSTACEIQSALGAVNATAFDINAACSGFLFGLGIANAYFTSGTFKKALIIGAETLSKMMNWDDRSTCVLFGDGAGAAIVEAAEDGIISMTQGSDGAKGGVLSCYNRPVNNPFVKNDTALDYTSMNGQEVFKFAVRTVPEAITKVLGEANVNPDEVKYFVLHQANVRIIESVAKRLNQPMDKFPTNLHMCGNTSAASVPILLDEINKKGMLEKGDKIVLAGFGAGLTWGAALINW